MFSRSFSYFCVMKRLFFAVVAVISAALGLRAENVYYNVGPFCRLSVRGDVDVVYRCNPDSTGMARYDDAAFPEEPFELSIKKGKLDVRRPADATGERPVLFVWSDFLMEATNEGLGEMTLSLGASVPEFSATLIGNGKIVVDNIRATEVSGAVNTGNGTVVMSGECKEASFSMVGAGLIQADHLDAEKVSCRALGTGTIGCWPSETLSVQGIGTAKIYYKGEPQIKKTGAARLFPMMEEDADQAAAVEEEPLDGEADDE